MNFNICPVTSFFQIWNVYPYMVLFTTFVQTKFRPCKLNLDRTVYTVFRNIRFSSKSLNVLNTVFSKQNISCFEIRWPRPIWLVNVFFMHSASEVDIYRAQRKHINYSMTNENFASRFETQIFKFISHRCRLSIQLDWEPVRRLTLAMYMYRLEKIFPVSTTVIKVL
jgi:hypothetical protein